MKYESLSLGMQWKGNSMNEVMRSLYFEFLRYGLEVKVTSYSGSLLVKDNSIGWNDINYCYIGRGFLERYVNG